MEEKEKAAAESAAEPAAKAAAPKRRRGVVVVCVCVAVLLAAGIGFMVWHEQPSFCSTVCHTPMSTYVESYYSTDGTTLASTHAKAGKTCLTCHTPKLSEQLTEGASWISGNYAYDSATDKLISRSGEIATQEFCLNESCHNMDLDKLKNKTSYMAWNPHDFSEHGVTDCGDCHKMHSTSVFVCSECHYQAAENVPEGWDSIPYRETR